MLHNVTCTVINLVLINLFIGWRLFKTYILCFLGGGGVEGPWFAHSPGPNLPCLHSCHFLHLAQILYPEYGSQCSLKNCWYLLTRLYSTAFHTPLCSLFHIIFNHNIDHRKWSNTTFLMNTFPMPLQLHLFDDGKWMCKHQKGVFSPFCSENVQHITTWLYKKWSCHFSLQVWTMTGKFIEQQVRFTWHHTARWYGGNSETHKCTISSLIRQHVHPLYVQREGNVLEHTQKNSVQ